MSERKGKNWGWLCRCGLDHKISTRRCLTCNDTRVEFLCALLEVTGMGIFEVHGDMLYKRVES